MTGFVGSSFRGRVRRGVHGREERNEAGDKERAARATATATRRVFRTVRRAQYSNARRDDRRKCHFGVRRDSRSPAFAIESRIRRQNERMECGTLKNENNASIVFKITFAPGDSGAVEIEISTALFF